MKIPRLPLVSSLALLAAALPIQADVWIVDNVHPEQADFSNIQPAINAALSGDTIVVRGGGDAYKRFHIDGKGLTVVADTHGVRIAIHENEIMLGSQPAIEVRQITEDQDVVVRGFDLNFGVVVEDCAGGVWFDEVRVEGYDFDGICTTVGIPGATVRNASKLTFTHCALGGQDNASSFYTVAVADGLIAESSTVQLFDSQITGGWGSNGWAELPQDGGAGVRMDSSTLTLVGCTVAGGGGGMYGNQLEGSVCDGDHGAGGAGVLFAGGANTLRQADTTITGGVADFDLICPGLTGPAGFDIEGTGTVVALPGVARKLTANSPASTGERVAFHLKGLPGELAVVLVSLDHQPLALPIGTLLGDPASFVRLSAGVVDAAGEAHLTLPVPDLAQESLTLFAQAAFVDASAGTWLGGGAAIVLLDF